MKTLGERPLARREPDGYRDLLVWKMAVELAIECYQQTAAFPLLERHGLGARVRRLAVSIVSNIAEGHGLGSRSAFAIRLSAARASLEELESQLVVAERLGYVDAEGLAGARRLCLSVRRMLAALQNAVRPGCGG